ncbi:TPA: hypothetical protein ACKPX2_004695 [Stenotrophomonas maltophilia]
MSEKDKWYDFGEALAITAGLMTASGAMFAAPSRLFPVPGLQYVVAIAVAVLAMRICIGAGWRLGGTFKHPRTTAAVAIGTSVIYSTMIGSLVVALIERGHGA